MTHHTAYSGVGSPTSVLQSFPGSRVTLCVDSDACRVPWGRDSQGLYKNCCSCESSGGPWSRGKLCVLTWWAGKDEDRMASILEQKHAR